MHAQGRSAEVLRFEIVVNSEAYRSLVAGLRGASTSLAPRALRGGVRAQVDLNLASRSFSVTTLGTHRLPSAIAVKPGSATHNSIAGLISRSVQGNELRPIAALIQDIIGAAPHIADNTLAIRTQDIEIRPGARAAAPVSPLHSVRLLAEAAPTISLELDDSPTLIIPDSQEDLLARATACLRQELRVAAPITATVLGNIVTIRAALQVPPIPGAVIDIFAHWGSYEKDVAPLTPWFD